MKWLNFGNSHVFHPTLYWTCDYLSLMEIKLIRVNKQALGFFLQRTGLMFFVCGLIIRVAGDPLPPEGHTLSKWPEIEPSGTGLNNLQLNIQVPAAHMGRTWNDNHGACRWLGTHRWQDIHGNAADFCIKYHILMAFDGFKVGFCWSDPNV